MKIRKVTPFELAIFKAQSFSKNSGTMRIDVMLALEVCLHDIDEVTELDRNELQLITGLLLNKFEMNEKLRINC
jgi:hypothetical protein